MSQSQKDKISVANTKDDRTHKICPKCRESKPLSEFGVRWNNFTPRSYCIKCEKEFISARSKSNWADPEKRKSLSAKHREFMLKRHGVDQGWYDRTLEAQSNKCAICFSSDPGRHPTNRFSFFVDHDHATGAARGLLCSACNTGLGLFKDNVDLLHSAMKYLENHRPPKS